MSSPVVFDNVLPARVYSELRRALVGIEPMRQSSWIVAGSPPRNLVEEVVLALGAFVAGRESVVGVEWWVREAPIGVAKEFHFDKDEARALAGEFVHPRHGSVFYLSDLGGSTVLSDRRCGKDGQLLEPAADARYWSVAPRENRYLVFDGRVLHGVRKAEPREGAMRTTLLVNWWEERISNAEVLIPPAWANEMALSASGIA